MKIKITWKVDDGHTGRSRSQSFVFNTGGYIDDEDWKDLSKDEQDDLIYEAVQEEFENNITWKIQDRIIIEE